MKPLSLSRREFLEISAGAGSSAALAQAAPSTCLGQVAAVSALTPDPVPAWASKPMRWMQLTLVEDDPIHYDAAFWIDYCKRTQSEGACLSGGGCVAYYPTEIPFHHRSAWLGDRDVLGELITGCRKPGMTILIRTDPHATYDDAKAGPSGLDCGGRGREAAAALVVAGDVAYLRIWAVQLRVHDRGAQRDHDAVSRGWALS